MQVANDIQIEKSVKVSICLKVRFLPHSSVHNVTKQHEFAVTLLLQLQGSLDKIGTASVCNLNHFWTLSSALLEESSDYFTSQRVNRQSIYSGFHILCIF